MKTLTKEAVCLAATQLIEQNGNTTTLDVKNRLRNQGYTAFQADVSQFMDTVQREENWNFSNNGKYKIYRPGPDTSDIFKKYTENGDQFWEILVQGKEQIVSSGRIETNGILSTKAFQTNRQAMSHAKNLYQQKLQEGFADAVDRRLSLKLRKRFAPYLEQMPVKCCLGYFDITKKEKQKATFTTDTQKVEGYWVISKNAGYEFHWQAAEAQETLKNILLKKDTRWNAAQTSFEKKVLLGEKVTEKKAFSLQEQELSTFESVEAEEEEELLDLEVKNENLYSVAFLFENGEKLALSKFNLDMEEELIPVVRKILTNV